MSAVAPECVASRRIFEPDLGREAVKLLPCEYFVTTEGAALLTVLGSCVAACVHDPGAGVAGMNHFMLPHDGQAVGQAAPKPCGPGEMRYGHYAMRVLIEELLRAGARRERLQAKVFGGAAVLPNMPNLNVGDRNAAFILQFLRAERIDVSAHDLGGCQARRVCFLADSGKVVVRRLRAAHDLELVSSQESEFFRRFAPDGRLATA